VFRFLPQGSIVIKSRAAGLLVHGNRVVLARHAGQDFWTVPGGKQERGESLEECVAREFREETGFDVVATRLLYVGDFITDAQQTLDVCFLLTFAEPPTDVVPRTIVDGSLCAIQWFDIADAACLMTGPPALRRVLEQLGALAGDGDALPTFYAGRYSLRT
jgi:ADP-ribose pyrophosphatase YjhB (NUDIX family)